MKYFLIRLTIFDSGEVVEQKCFSEDGNYKRCRRNFLRRHLYGKYEKIPEYECILAQEYDVY